MEDLSENKTKFPQKFELQMKSEVWNGPLGATSYMMGRQASSWGYALGTGQRNNATG